MKLFDYVDEVRNRPLGARRRFAITVAVVFCGLIFGAWLMVVTSGFGTIHYTSPKELSATPIDTISGGLREAVDGIKTLGETLKNLKNLGSSSTITVEREEVVSEDLLEEGFSEVSSEEIVEETSE